MTVDMANLDTYDKEQVKLMQEVCIVIDENDNANYAPQSKKVCHLMKNIEKGLLHRAFSVFLFDKNNRLLLQQRSDEKITFPGYWTNTCCSHPLAIAGEMDETDNIGVKRAAIRKLEQELGITLAPKDSDKLTFLTRIHYLAPSDGANLWGEHEIDYILFIKTDVELKLNYNEVKAVRYIQQDELRALFKDPSVKLTPWFKLIVENFIFKWWDALDTNLQAHVEATKIHVMLPSVLPWDKTGGPKLAASLPYDD